MSSWVVQRQARMSMLAALSDEEEEQVKWALLRVEAGEAEQVGMFSKEGLARRVADLLTRNGIEDVPLSDLHA